MSQKWQGGPQGRFDMSIQRWAVNIWEANEATSAPRKKVFKKAPIITEPR